jgi:phosphatidylinositol alpha-1,6-mannosyltransferase
MHHPLLLTLEYPPQHGGVAKYLEGEVKNFDGRVKVVDAQEHLMLLWPQWLPLLWKSRSQFDEHKCDSLWISHILPIGYIALVYKKLFKISYRVYLHGLDLVRPRKYFWKYFFVKLILNNAEEIVVNSNATAELLRYYDIDPSIARVQYPRIEKIDTEKYKNLGDELRKKYAIGDRPVLLTISRLVKRKGIDLVVSAIPEVLKEIPNLIYIIVGDGDYSDHLKKLAYNNKNIIFTGAVSEQEKYAWLSASNVFILTPIDDPDDFEGYGIVYKEAQMFGKPVIGSTVGGVPEAVGDEGVLVNYLNKKNEISDAILKQIKKPVHHKM